MTKTTKKPVSIEDRLIKAEEILSNIQGDRLSPDEYRETCIRSLALKSAQLCFAVNQENQDLNLNSEIEELTDLVEAFDSQEDFTTTSEDDSKRIKTFYSRENKLFRILRSGSRKLILQDKQYLNEAKQLAISGVRFAEQCQANSLVRNKQVPFCQVAAFLILTRVEILKHNFKPASELLAKAKYALNNLKSEMGLSVLPRIGCKRATVVDEESLEYLGIQVLHVEGLLRAELGQYELALESHAHEIIAATRLYNTPSLINPGYYQIANIHFKQKRLSLATSFYTKAAELWIDGEGSCLERLGYIEKCSAMKTLKHIVDMYSGMNETVRNREECLGRAELALKRVEG